jgi:hypothetical protein
MQKWEYKRIDFRHTTDPRTDTLGAFLEDYVYKVDGRVIQWRLLVDLLPEL